MISYDFYPIECRNISETDCGIAATYMAKPSRPTIMYVDDKKNKILYHATELRVAGRIHSMIAHHDGELILHHMPSTVALPIECHFPFVHDPTHEATDIDAFLLSKDNSYFTNVFIDMNTHTTDATAATQYKKKDKHGREIRVILFHQLITIKHDVNALYVISQQCTELLQMQSLEYKLQTPAIIKKRKQKIDSFFFSAKGEAEGKGEGEGGKGKGKESAATPQQKEKEKEKEKEKDKEKDKEKEGDTDKDQEMEKDKETMEGFEKMVFGDNNEEVIYECEYLPVDSDDMIQVLQIPVGSPGLSTLVNSNVSSLFINNAIILFAFVLIFFTMPLFYRFIRIKVNQTKYSFLFDEIAYMMQNFEMSMNIVGVVAVITCALLTVLLLACGMLLRSPTAVAIGIFLPFFTFFSYISIIHK
jgi:hypothetical protein